MTKLSMDGTDPATGDPALDGVLAAPENYTVLKKTRRSGSSR